MGAKHSRAKLTESEEQSQHQQLAKLPESEELEKVIKLLEERLEKHDENRKAAQDKLKEVQNKLTGQIDRLEERINKELEENFIPEDDRLQAALNELCGNSTINALQNAKEELRIIQSYEIIVNKKPNDLTTLYELKIKRRTISEDDSAGLVISEVDSSTHNPSDATENGESLYDTDKFAEEEQEKFIKLLEERLQTQDNNRKAVQDKIHETCEGLRVYIDELEDRANKELEEKFIPKDNGLQAALNELRGNRTASAFQKAKAELLMEQSYEVIENKIYIFGSEYNLTTLYELKTEKHIVPELMEMRKPTNIRVTSVNRGIVSVDFTCFNPDEERVLSDNPIVNPVEYKCMIFKKDNEQEGKEYPLIKNENNGSFFTFTPDFLEAETTYGIRAKMVVGDKESEWSDDVAEFKVPEFKECCAWKKCPDDVNKMFKYNVDEKNPRVASNNEFPTHYIYDTIIGNTYIPLNKVTSWSIKVLESKNNDGEYIYIGVAPFDIDQRKFFGNYDECGWYFYYYESTLYSGPPHSYRGKKYGPWKGYGQYVHTGGSVGVIMDTKKGKLSFALDGVNLGVAYERIPLNKPLVPCVILIKQGDSVELII